MLRLALIMSVAAACGGSVRESSEAGAVSQKGPSGDGMAVSDAGEVDRAVTDATASSESGSGQPGACDFTDPSGFHDCIDYGPFNPTQEAACVSTNGATAVFSCPTADQDGCCTYVNTGVPVTVCLYCSGGGGGGSGICATDMGAWTPGPGGGCG
jgi:hypothetical protein